MERLVKAYIDKRIQKARTSFSDELAASGVDHWGNMPVESARLQARSGFTAFTASYLQLDNTLLRSH